MNNDLIEITDEYIIEHSRGTNYGHENYRAIIEQGCLKALVGYINGSTTTTILIEMGLITEKTHVLTQRGREFLFRSFSRRASNGRLADRLAEYENMEPVGFTNEVELAHIKYGLHGFIQVESNKKSFLSIPLYRHLNK